MNIVLFLKYFPAIFRFCKEQYQKVLFKSSSTPYQQVNLYRANICMFYTSNGR